MLKFLPYAMMRLLNLLKATNVHTCLAVLVMIVEGCLVDYGQPTSVNRVNIGDDYCVSLDASCTNKKIVLQSAKSGQYATLPPLTRPITQDPLYPKRVYATQSTPSEDRSVSRSDEPKGPTDSTTGPGVMVSTLPQAFDPVGGGPLVQGLLTRGAPQQIESGITAESVTLRIALQDRFGRPAEGASVTLRTIARYAPKGIDGSNDFAGSASAAADGVVIIDIAPGLVPATHLSGRFGYSSAGPGVRGGGRSHRPVIVWIAEMTGWMPIIGIVYQEDLRKAVDVSGQFNSKSAYGSCLLVDRNGSAIPRASLYTCITFYTSGRSRFPAGTFHLPIGVTDGRGYGTELKEIRIDQESEGAQQPSEIYTYMTYAAAPGFRPGTGVIASSASGMNLRAPCFDEIWSRVVY